MLMDWAAVWKLQILSFGTHAQPSAIWHCLKLFISVLIFLSSAFSKKTHRRVYVWPQAEIPSRKSLQGAMGLWNGWAWNWTCCTHPCTESSPRDSSECHTETYKARNINILGWIHTIQNTTPARIHPSSSQPFKKLRGSKNYDQKQRLFQHTWKVIDRYAS